MIGKQDHQSILFPIYIKLLHHLFLIRELAEPNGDNLIFLGDKTLWVNSKGEKKAYLYTSSKMFRVGEKFFIYSLDGKKIYEFPL